MSAWPWEGWVEVRLLNRNVWPTGEDGRRRGMELLPPVTQWLAEHVGAQDTIREEGQWRYSLPITDTWTAFWFRDDGVACLLKLTWG